MENSTPQVVTIAGSDSGGGAGIQADLKTFQARQTFGMSIIVALTAQNTKGVQASLMLPSEFIDAQFASLKADFKIGAVKTGMLADTERVETVARNLSQANFGPLIVDPVMIAKGGHPLLDKDAVSAVKKKLLPLATIVTPNIPEAEELLGAKLKTPSEIVDGAREIQKTGVKNVIIKGGHAEEALASDYILLEDGTDFWLSAPRIPTRNTHGTGDTFSSCIAAELAKGVELKAAIITAKRFIQGAIEEGIFVGHGHGPVNHWAKLSNHISSEAAE